MTLRLAALAALLVTIATLGEAQTPPSRREMARWAAHARAVTITRDDWGIAHVHGRTDADAVFGMIFAQAEDDFNRVETNYLNSLGWLAQAEGEGKVWQDLRQRLFIDTLDLERQYGGSPAWLRRLMDGWADGLNFYLHTHPDVTPRVIRRFAPWMALSFSEGSIGGDIERVRLSALESFYGKPAAAPPPATGAAYTPPAEPRGSNGIAVAPRLTRNGRALLLINPHTSFFFRSELKMESDEGLNAYGAVTWGQFFVYQGFNDRAGWMHTSSGVDAVDEYRESIVQRGDRFYYRHGAVERPVQVKTIAIPYRTPTGMATRSFTTFRTHHGPVVRELDGRWVSIALMQEPVKALSQSYLRTKARSYRQYLKTMELKANSSNNTIYADADGNIAYFHGNFIPRRDTTIDFTKPVEGSDPRTDWQGLLSVADAPHLLNPASGFLFNVNDAPWAGAGASSLRRADFPRYVETGGESYRTKHAIRLLDGASGVTLESLIGAAYDSYLPYFAELVPALLRDYDALAATDSMRSRLADQIAALRGWDFRWSATSVPTALGVYLGEDLARRVSDTARVAGIGADEYAARRATGAQRLASLAAASDSLAAAFGSWRTPWGEINRFQRRTGDIVQPFSDSVASIPVPFASARWGSLASFGARRYPGTRRWYGTSGNSFVAVVEFGRDSVRARAVSAGGESGHPSSPHFNDQAARYAAGALRPVYFYPSQLVGHVERKYSPGGGETVKR